MPAAQGIKRRLEHVRRLMAETHLPRIDVQAVERYILAPAERVLFEEEDDPQVCKQSLSALRRLARLLTAHRDHTLQVLEQVDARERALTQLWEALDGGHVSPPRGPPIFGRPPPTEAEQRAQRHADVYRALYAVQRSTLEVIEAVQLWRTALSLPYPFLVVQHNYICKIAYDSHQLLTHPSLIDAFPERSPKHPLFSHCPALSKFMVSDEDRLLQFLSRSSAIAPPTDGKMQKRVAVAEMVIHAEVETQLGVLHRLLCMCYSGYAAPTLDLSSFYPAMYVEGKPHAPSTLRGIRVGPTEQQEVEQALKSSLGILTDPVFKGEFESWRRQQRGGGDGEEEGGVEAASPAADETAETDNVTQS